MNILIQERNYIPIDIKTRFYACRIRTVFLRPVIRILFFFIILNALALSMLKRFDGTKESLYDKSHNTLSDHPKKQK